MTPHKYFIHLSILLCLASCSPSDKPADSNKPDPQPEFPTPPEQTKEANVFIIDFFSTLEDEGDFFISRDAGVAADYIKAQSGKRSIVYMFDRADYQISEEQAATKIAYQVSAFPYFAQSAAAKAETIPGTAMVTRYPISDTTESQRMELTFLAVPFSFRLPLRTNSALLPPIYLTRRRQKGFFSKRKSACSRI